MKRVSLIPILLIAPYVFAVAMFARLPPGTAAARSLTLAQSEAPERSTGLDASLIAAAATIVGVIIAGVPAIIMAWAKLKEITLAANVAAAAAREAATAGASATTLAQKNLDLTKEVDVKVNGHWSEIEKKLNERDSQVVELLEAVKVLTAAVAVADKDAAVAAAERVALERAALVKELADARAGAQPPALAAPAATPQTAAPLTITGGLPEMVEAAKVIAGAAPQLDKIEQTGEATHAIVSEDRTRKPDPKKQG